jgi:hypothetical protein
VVRDDVDDMVNNVVYHYFEAADRGEAYDIPPKLTEEEQLAVAVLINQEKRRAFLGYKDALALSVAPPPRGQSPGTRGLELHLRGRGPHHRSWAELSGRRLHRPQWRTGRGRRGRSLTSPTMTTTSRPCRRRRNPA